MCTNIGQRYTNTASVDTAIVVVGNSNGSISNISNIDTTTNVGSMAATTLQQHQFRIQFDSVVNCSAI